MDITAQALVQRVQNVRCAYVQSDEISLLLIDYNTLNTQQWFEGNIQKMVSISAAIASTTFTKAWSVEGLFDSRVFILPPAEVTNYFLWRQLDATRNSINMVAQSLYSHKELQHVNIKEAQELIFQRGINWNDYESYWKRGRVVTKEGVDRNIPIFTEDRNYIEKFMEIEEL
jgi:tRNA(His) 5'-end guanylyltransferase